jgi:hypothetical protein
VCNYGRSRCVWTGVADAACDDVRLKRAFVRSCLYAQIHSYGRLMSGSGHTLIEVPVDNRHLPLMPLVAFRMTVRIGK